MKLNSSASPPQPSTSSLKLTAVLHSALDSFAHSPVHELPDSALSVFPLLDASSSPGGGKEEELVNQLGKKKGEGKRKELKRRTAAR